MSVPSTPPAGRRLPPVVWLVAFAAVVVVAAVVLIAVLGGDDTDPGAGPSSTTGPSTPTSTSGVSEPLPTTPPSSAPQDVTWALVGQTAVPTSAAAGPDTVAGGTASGFAHTPVGALVAAAQISARAAFSAGRDSWEPTIERQFVPSDDRDRLVAALEAAGDTPAAPGELSQIAGFQYLSYSPDTAVIGLAMRAPSAGTPRYHVLTLTVVWRDGDWRMVAPPGGAWTSVNRVATDLTGVVEWGAR
jgi:hypothetical protein